MLGLGLLSDESSLRNSAPPGRLTQIVISPTHTEIFLEFLVFFNKQIKRQKREKLFTWESSPQTKEEQGNLLGFSF